MPKVVLQSDVAAHPDIIWAAIKDFSSVAQWNPLVRNLAMHGSGVGSVRTVDLEGAGQFVERLDEVDDSERVYSYSVIDSPLPMSECSVEVRVKDNGDGTSTVEWKGDFAAEKGDELRAVRTFQQLYQDALDRLQSRISLSG